MDLHCRYPCVDDMERAALRRIPKFASEYLRSGIGREACLGRNRRALDDVLFDAVYLPEQPANDPILSTSLFGREYALPFGICPLGLSGLMWPGAVDILAKAARDANIPMALSHHATTDFKTFRGIAGENGWFQMYPPHDAEIRSQMLSEVAEAGFDTLVVTVDVTTDTRRDRDLRVGLSVPPKFNASTVWEVMTHPRWAIATAMTGIPEFKNFKPYLPKGVSLAEESRSLLDLVEGHVTRDALLSIRDQWKGTLIVKGVSCIADAKTAVECGADGIWVSNHGGRQLDAAPATTEMLPEIRAAMGQGVPIMVDSGPRTGLDIARMLATGADFVFLGRAFIFAVAAIGARGGDHAIAVLKEELRCALAQIGAGDIASLSSFLRA